MKNVYQNLIKKTLIRRRIAISVKTNLNIVLNIFSGILPNIDLPKFVPMYTAEINGNNTLQSER